MSSEGWGGWRMDVVGLEDPGPLMRIVSKCLDCDEVLADREYDSSDPAMPELAKAQGLTDAALAHEHGIAKHGAKRD